MKILNYKGEEFYIAHFQGWGLADYILSKHRGIPDFLLNIPISNIDIDNIQIITIATINELDNMVLIKQLEYNNLPYINDGLHEDISNGWFHIKKIPIILKSLKVTNKEYSLYLDARDVIIIKDFDNFLKLFISKNIKIMFGATINNFPNVKFDDFIDRSKYGRYKYLNAGTIFGKTSDLISYFEYLENIKNDIPNINKDDQYLIRYTLKDFNDDIGINYECDLFQTFGFSNLKLINKDQEIYQAEPRYNEKIRK